MAEVTGDLGGQPIQLSNAATETTLQQLLAVMLSQAAKGGKQKLKDEKELREELDRLGKAAKSARTQLAESAKDVEGKKAREATVEHYKNMGKGMANFTQGLSNMISSMANYASTLANMGNKVGNATDALGKIPVVGGILAATLGAVAKEAERQQKAFQQSAAVGATFGGGINEMINSATSMGLTFDQFTGIINKTGKDLAFLGAGSADGAKQLVKYSTAMRKSGLQDDLARLGFSSEDITESLAIYGAQLRKTGYSQAQIDATLVQSTGEYLKNLDAVSKLTGEDRKDLEKKRKEMANDAQIKGMLQGRSLEEQEAFYALMQSLPASMQPAFKSAAATGTLIGEGAAEFMTVAPQMAAAAMEINRTFRSGGELTMDTAKRMQKTGQEEARRNVARNKEYTAYQLNALGQMAAAQIDLGNQTTTLGEALDETGKAAKVKTDKNDPAVLMRQQQEVARTSNQVSLTLASAFQQIIPILDTFHRILRVYVLPTLSYFSENIGLALVAIAGLKLVSVLAVKGFERLLGMIASRALGSALASGAGGAAGRAGGTTAGRPHGGVQRPAGGAAGGISSMVKTVIGIVASMTTAKFILGALVIGGLFALLFSASKKETRKDELARLRKQRTEDPDSLSNEDTLRLKQLEQLEARDSKRLGPGDRSLQERTAKGLTVGGAEAAIQSKLTDAELEAEYGFNREILSEFVKQTKQLGKGQRADILKIAAKLQPPIDPNNMTIPENAPMHSGGVDLLAEAEQKKLFDQLDVSALEQFNDNAGAAADATSNVTTEANNLAGSMAVAAELAKIQQELDQKRANLIDRIALEGRKFDLEKLQRDQEQLKVTDKLVTATKEEVAIKEKNNQCKGYDFSSPEALFKSFRDKNMQPGATAAVGSTSTTSAALQVSAGSQLQGPQKEFYDKLYTTLLEEATKAGVKNPEAIARLGAAQSSIETGYGKALAGGNNFFGIKGSGGNQQTTQEFDPKTGKMVTQKASFRQYGNMQESAADYIKFLQTNSRYKGVLEAGSVEDAIAAQGKTGYATDPDYAKKLAFVQSRATGARVNLPGTAGAAPPSPAVTPTATAATSALTNPPAAVPPGQTTLNRPGAGAPGAGGASPVNELASAIERLNSMTAQIVGSSRDLVDVSRQQLTAIKTINRVV